MFNTNISPKGAYSQQIFTFLSHYFVILQLCEIFLFLQG